MTEAASVIAIARTWIGTPYRHQASLRGVGCDCLGLVRGVWREVYGVEPEAPPAYQPDWAERGGEDRLRDAALRHFGGEIGRDDMRPGGCAAVCLAGRDAGKTCGNPERFGAVYPCLRAGGCHRIGAGALVAAAYRGRVPLSLKR